jgi:hypothetical protein
MYNTANVNPAYAGSRETLTAFLLHRNQWVGLEGAPVTNNFTVNTPIGDSNLELEFHLQMIKLDQHLKTKYLQI